MQRSLVMDLVELRQRCIYVCLWFMLFFLIFFFVANELFYFLIRPLLIIKSAPTYLLATQITSPLVTPLGLAADASFLCTTPFALFQLWRFCKPGLYIKERLILRWVSFFSITLFFIGVAFCYYMILPWMLYYFANNVPKGVHYLPEISSAVDFITRMLLIFGICFQMPLVSWLLVKLGLLSYQQISNLRPYFIVSAFIIGMLLTPPDVLSQILLAIPLCFLFEFGLLLARIFPR